MIYCNLKGGLCNILFQIAATYAFARENNTDPSFPNLNLHLDYLNKETIHNPKLNYAEEYLNIFKNCKTISPQENIKIYHYPFHYESFIPPNDSVVDGFFQSEKYFIKYKNDIINYLTVSEDIQKYIKNILNTLPKKFNIIHVRFGDFLNNPNYHYNIPIDYFLKSVDKLNSNLPYVIFSDDIDLCKKYFLDNKYIFMSGNKDYIDLFLMTYGENYILSNSTFGWWGAWMNINHKRVFVPSKWFGPNLNHLNKNDLIPSTWEVQNI
jgi:hypothetical protein